MPSPDDIIQVIDPLPLDGIAYEELEGSPKEHYGDIAQGAGDTAFTATRELLCEWDDRHELSRRLKGDIGSEGDKAVIFAPHHYPAFMTARVAGIDLEPFDSKVSADGNDTTKARYVKAKLTVHYTSQTYSTDQSGGGGDADPYVEENLEPWTEFITRSHEKLWWDPTHDEPLEDTEAPGFLVRGFEWLYIRHHLRQVPRAVLDLTGLVNSADIVSKKYGWTFPAETLLYNPPKLSWETFASGIAGVTLEQRFTYRPGGWNKFYRKGKVDPQPIYDDTGTLLKLYVGGDFTKLVG